MNKKHEEKIIRWQSHLESWRQSGLSQMVYCESHNLKPHQFWYWKRKLEKTDKPDGVTRQPSESRGVRKPAASPTFVPIRLAANYSAENGISLELPGGIRIHRITPDTFSWLPQLIQELSGS